MKQTAVFNSLPVQALLIAFIMFGCIPSGDIEISNKKPTPTVPTESETIVSLTFDDGNEDNFIVGNMLKEHGLSATFYVSSGLTGQPGFMSWDQLDILEQAGNEIGGHTWNHLKLEGVDNNVLTHEICDDRQNLMDHGFTVTSFAYPNGYFDKQVKRTVESCGYDSARTIAGGVSVIPPPSPYSLTALPYIVSDTTTMKLKKYVSTTRKNGGGWVILVFHHVCDSCDFFSVKPDVLDQFIGWLDQQKENHVTVKTIGEVMHQTPHP